MLPIRAILHPTDFSERSESAFQLACALARDHGARLVVLNVMVPPVLVVGNGLVVPEPPTYREESAEKLRQLKALVPGVAIEHHLVEGDPVREILRVAKDSSADLIVMGTHGWTGLARLLMGSVAENVVRKAECPVLTLKTPFPAAKSAPEPVRARAALEPAGL
jgi:nucleotide-binding universal stress UspA family protein